VSKSKIHVQITVLVVASRYWQSLKVEVIVSTANISTLNGCTGLISEATALAPVGGIFNFAAALRDAMIANQTVENFAQSLAPKAIATRHLHDVSLTACPQLQHFVVYSSISCGRGSPGQTNYGMSNSVMERIVGMRHEMGLPAKAIQWGPIGDVGLLADADIGHKAKLNFDVPMQSLASFLEHHDCLLLHPAPIVACTVTVDKSTKAVGKECFIDLLMRALNIEDRKTIAMSSTFSQLGIDSLASIEMQQMIQREYGQVLSMKDLITMTITELEAKIMQRPEV
jgi:fatty acid synthase